MKKLLTLSICFIFTWSANAQIIVNAPKTILPGHNDDVLSLSYSIRNSLLASAGRDNTISIYNVDSPAKLIKTISGHLSPITAIRFNNMGNLLVSGSNDFSVCIYDSTFKKIRDYSDPTGHQSTINTVLFDNKSKGIFSGDERGKIILWTLESSKKVRVYENGVSVNALTMGQDPRYIFVAGAEPNIKVMSLANGQTFRTFTGHTDAVNAIEISPNQNYLISGSNDKSARIWDMKTGKELRKLNVDCWKVTAVAFTYDSKYCATGCNDGSIKVWEVETGTLVQNIPPQGFNTRDICFFKNYTEMAVASTLKNSSTYGVRLYNTSLSLPVANIGKVNTLKPINKNQNAIDSILKIRPLTKLDSSKFLLQKNVLPPTTSPIKPNTAPKIDSVRIFKTPSK